VKTVPTSCTAQALRTDVFKQWSVFLTFHPQQEPPLVEQRDSRLQHTTTPPLKGELFLPEQQQRSLLWLLSDLLVAKSSASDSGATHDSTFVWVCCTCLWVKGLC
jgi:hypothetical protein